MKSKAELYLWVLFGFALLLLIPTKIQYTLATDRHIFAFNAPTIHSNNLEVPPDSLVRPVVIPQQILEMEHFVYPDVILDPRQILLKKDIHFPLRYHVTGHADLTWESIIKKFYGTLGSKRELLERLQYYNPTLEFRPIEAGDILWIPAPDSPYNHLPDLIKANSFPTTPHQDILSPSGKIQMTAEEFDLFTRVLASEAGPKWEYEGIRMIAETITNRMRNKKINLFEVIMQPEQFSVIDSGAYLKATPSDLHRRVAIDVLEKNTLFSPDVEFFCTEEAYERVTWFQELRIVKRYGGVIFMSNQYDLTRRKKTAPTVSLPSTTGSATASISDQGASENNSENSETLPALEPTETIENTDLANDGDKSIKTDLFPISGEQPRQP